MTAADLELLEEAYDFLSELECEWRWKQNEPRAGNKAQYEQLAAFMNRTQGVILGLKAGLKNNPP